MALNKFTLPWGDQGFVIPEDSSVEDMLDISGLNWRVDKVPSYTEFKDPTGSEFVPIRGAYTLRRSDHTLQMNVPSNRAEGYDPLTVFVGKSYKPVQNDEALSVFMDFIDIGQMTMDTVGHLSEGRTIWGLANLNDGFTLADGDEIKGYLLLSQSHEYGNAMRVSLVTKHTHNQSTYTFSFTKVQGKNIGVYRLRHSRAWSIAEIERIKLAIGYSHEKINQYKENVEKMINIHVSEPDMIKYIMEIFDQKGILEIISDGDQLPQTVLQMKNDKRVNRVSKKFLDITDSMPGNHGQNTAWELFNRVLYYFDHINGRNISTRLESSWFGVNAKTKNRALYLALSL